MTISTTITKNSHSGNGVTTEFSFPYKFLADGDLVVTLVVDSTGVATVQTITTHYTVAGAGADAGGTVTMVTPPASGETLVISRQMALTQESDYVEGDEFPADTHETALDRAMMVAQQQNEELSRAIRFPAEDTADGEIGTAIARASKVLGFDANGDVELQAGVGNWQGNWVTSTAYALRDVVKDAAGDDSLYVCTEAHTSGTLATDISAGKWETMVDMAAVDAVQTAAEAAQTAAETAQTGAETAETNAAASAAAAAADEVLTNADAIATAADAVSTAADAAAAAASASAAATSETNSGTSETNAAASAVAAAAAASAGMYKDVVVLTFADSPYTVLAANDGDLFKIDTSGGNVVINAPDLSGESADLRFAFVKDTADANTVTINRQGTDTINGGTTTTITGQYQALNLIGDQSTGKWTALDATTGTALIATNNLSDVTSAATARQNLGLELGVDAQAYEAGLAYLAGLTFTNEATFKAGVNLEIGTDVQAYDAAIMKTDVAQTMTAQLTTKETAATEYSLTGTVVDPANGDVQYKTLSGNTTLTESLENGQAVLLMIDDGTAYTLTHPTITWLTDAGSAPTLATTGYTGILYMQMNGTLYGMRVTDGG